MWPPRTPELRHAVRHPCPGESATNVSIRRDLLEAARASKINLSATLEQALIGKLREAQQRQMRRR